MQKPISANGPNAVAVTLLVARALIEDPRNWTQGDLARDIHGAVVPLLSPEASAWSALAAIYVAADPNIDLVIEATAALRQVLEMSISEFNDTSTHQEVLGAFGAAWRLEWPRGKW